MARVNVEKAWIVVHSTTEQWSESAVLAEVEQAIAVFERLGDDVALARALEVVDDVHPYFGRLSDGHGRLGARLPPRRARPAHVKLQGSIASAARSPTSGARPRSTGRTICSRRISPGRGGPGASESRPVRR